MINTVDIVWWFVFIVLSLFFSGIDMAFVSSDKLQYAVSKKNKGLNNFMLNSIYSHSREFLATLMIGEVITLVLFVNYTFIIFGNLLENYIHHEWIIALLLRSEERRVGKECRSWWSPCDYKEDIV